MARIPAELSGIPVLIRRSRKRRRTVSLSIHPAHGIILSAPQQTTDKFLEDFFTSRLSWIETKIGFFKNRADFNSAKPVGRALEKHCRDQARIHVEEKISRFGSILGVRPNAVKINSAKTRWGSCSARNNLNFPWRIAMLPSAVIDYIVVHELAHIKEKNHGPGFWKTVADVMPDFKNHRTWLRKNSHLFAIRT